MNSLVVSRNFEGGSFPEEIESTPEGLRLQKNHGVDHFFFHFSVTNPSQDARVVHVTCQWPLTNQRYWLFPELKRSDQPWQSVSITPALPDGKSDPARAEFSFPLGARETVFLANTPCMGATEVQDLLRSLASRDPDRCALFSLSTGEQRTPENEVTGLRWDPDPGAGQKPKLVILGTPEGPEYGDRLACAVAEFLTGATPPAMDLLTRFRIDVIPVPCPNLKRADNRAGQVLFDFGKDNVLWHFEDLWNYLVNDPPQRLLEFHTDTKLKGPGCQRVYVAAENVYKTPEQGRAAMALAKVVDSLPNGNWLNPMVKDSTWQNVLLYQVAARLDTIAIGYSAHIRYGVTSNCASAIRALQAFGK